MSHLVGLDVGTSSVKGLALSPTGAVLAVAERPLEVMTPRPGHSEQDPERWWEQSVAVLEELRRRAGGEQPLAIGLSGQMHGLVALDAGDRVLRPALLWNDQRTAVQAAEIEERLGGVRGAVEATGNRSMTGFTAPKLRWLARHEPEHVRRLATVLLPKDYVRLRLCGERATDVTDASGTGLFDPARREWSEQALLALDVDPAWLPVALESPQLSGHSAGGVPVAAGAGDQGAGAVGVGAVVEGVLSVVLGTSGVVLASHPTPRFDPLGRLQASCHARPDGWFSMGVILAAAGSLAWLSRITGADAATLVAEAERWAPGAEGLTFLPHLSGERTPLMDPDARGAFVGLEIRHDRGALARAVLEGVAFALRDALDLLPAAAQQARVSGGGARSTLWLRILASVLELPLTRPAVEEGAAHGAALLAGVAAEVWSDVPAAVAAAVSPRETIDPEPDWIGRYAAGRERYRTLH